MTYRELVYMILDELKVISDDSYFTEDHILFLTDKYRVFLLKQRYSDIKKQMPDSNYQTICLELEETPAMNGGPCEGMPYLKSIVKVPDLMKIIQPSISTIDMFQGIRITYVSNNRMKFVGNNRFVKNFIYTSIGSDGYLYLKSTNPQFLFLNRIKLSGVFEDSIEASKLDCTSNIDSCNILDKEFPIEGALVNPLIELVVNELTKAIYKPEDNMNDSKDNLSDLGVTKNTKNA